MTKSTYQVGRATEIEVKTVLEKEGWVCWRPPTSKFGDQDVFGLWDIICMRKDEIRFVQVKTGYGYNKTTLLKNLRGFFKNKKTIKLSKQLWVKKTTKKKGVHLEVIDL